MSHFRYFGSAVHALLHHLKTHARDGFTPPFETLGNDVEGIIRTSGRHIPDYGWWRLDPEEEDIIHRYWRYLYTLLGSYEHYWLKTELEGRKHDIIGVRGKDVEMVEVLTGQHTHKPLDKFSAHVGFQTCLLQTPRTQSLLEHTCRVNVHSRLLLIRNDLTHWHEPVWQDLPA